MLLKGFPAQEKKLKNWYIQEYTTGTTFEQKTFEKIGDDDNGGFQQQSPQYTVYRYEYMNGRNDRWMMRLKPIQVEYYPVENQKSYSNTM